MRYDIYIYIYVIRRLKVKYALSHVKCVTCCSLGHKWRRCQSGRVKKEESNLGKVYGAIKIENINKRRKKKEMKEKIKNLSFLFFCRRIILSGKKERNL